ncbi:hypothetical protein L6164_029969 [Bauhinia variegata]|uniref:Uncharacterized protein n=1 Tax=Bauhinia variegata TaxID=167791 RepID=A0ACB9LAA7_BAUVA|nr:hypothetical protein L6164_029969 [Bauhinia variegata]
MDPNSSQSSGLNNGFQIDDWNFTSNPEQFLNLADQPEINQNYSSPLPFMNNVDPVGFPSHTSHNFEGEMLIPSWGVGTAEGFAGVPPSSVASVADPYLEDDFSETYKYLSQILTEENFEEKPSMFYDPLSLQVTEKSFYDALKESNPLSPDQHPLDIHHSLDSPDNYTSSIDSSNNSSSSSTTANTASSIDLPWHDNPVELKPSSSVDPPPAGDYAFQFSSQSIPQKPSPPPNILPNFDEGLLDLGSSITELLAQNIYSDAESVSQFRKGLEEASKFLPRDTKLTTGLESNTLSLEPKGGTGKAVLKKGEDVRENSHGLKGRKTHEREGSDEEGRSNKQSAVYVDESELTDMFDRVLLSVENVPLCSEHGSVQSGSVKITQPSEQPNSSEGGKIRSKKKGKKKETVDLRTLLVLCAQAVSANDKRTADELLKQIRQHSSPFGDASQRLAHYFANGLEARLVGAATGAQIFYTSLSSKRISSTDILKAYQVLISACPFKKFSIFFANKMILKAAEKVEGLHIIDFGISYGFQWPILIKFLSERAGGPPKLRITGIEFPQAGFRPTERIEETGRRLANYCKRFNVPFEYKAIASHKWESIQIEELNINRNSNDLLVVNCLMRFRNLLDDTIEVNSPRNAVLSLIRKINPNFFVQTIVNGSYNAPFFVTRFREALFHFSAMYDMFETLIPRDCEWRFMLEKEFFGRELMNVVACEGLERVERPETYKQWQLNEIFPESGHVKINTDQEVSTLPNLQISNRIT